MIKKHAVVTLGFVSLFGMGVAVAGEVTEPTKLTTEQKDAVTAGSATNVGNPSATNVGNPQISISCCTFGGFGQ